MSVGRLFLVGVGDQIIILIFKRKKVTRKGTKRKLRIKVSFLRGWERDNRPLYGIYIKLKEVIPSLGTVGKL